MTFVSEVEEEDKTPETMEVHIDFTEVELDEYAAVIMAANYTSVRLRWLGDQDVAQDDSGKPIIHGNSGEGTGGAVLLPRHDETGSGEGLSLPRAVDPLADSRGAGRAQGNLQPGDVG